jgi:two-component sensor histidine kinase
MASETPDFFQPEHLEILEEVAASLAIALQQARLLEQTRQDAATKALLLNEVNHRVKNNLEAIIGLLYVERRHAPPEARAAFQPIVDDLSQRVMGLAKVHHMLSAAEWQPLVLSDLAEQLIHTAVRNRFHDVRVIVEVAPAPVRVSPAQAHHLALVISELTTNTLKYAVAGRDTVRITVCITQEDDVITLVYRNDGPGFPEEVLRLERHSAGLDIVKKIVRKNLRGELVLRNDDGAVTQMRFKPRKEI